MWAEVLEWQKKKKSAFSILLEYKYVNDMKYTEFYIGCKVAKCPIFPKETPKP